MHQYPAVYRCAIQSPLNRLFDYLPPEPGEADDAAQLEDQHPASSPRPGQRLWAPFGKRRVVALLVEVVTESPVEPTKIRHCEAFIDSEPLFSIEHFEFIRWIAEYYHHPLGDTVFGFLPTLLRKGRPASLLDRSQRQAWQLSTQGKGLTEPANSALKRAPKQAEMMTLLAQRGTLAKSELKEFGISPAVIRALADKQLIEPIELPEVSAHLPSKPPISSPGVEDLVLNDEQTAAIDAVHSGFGEFHCHLLHGITGSGKTEVYLQLIGRCLELGQHALVLVPEIGLTPQMLARFEARFGNAVLAIHSNLTAVQRLNVWLQARDGSTSIIIGTRSALMSPLPELGLIVVDEEHDGSFKQQDGLRYSARDLAIKRAQLANIPILLGSATPSLESLANVQQGKYQLLRLQQRAGDAVLPAFHLTDCRDDSAEEGISLEILQACRRHIAAGSQVLIFINRRGYAPTLICQQCGWMANCHSCDARMTAHLTSNSLICHHCEQRSSWPHKCPQCSSGLQTLGSGTQKLEQVLTRHFSDVPIIRVDRDSTQRKGALEKQLAFAHSGQPCILLGTQMLAKGHHFPKLSMAAILDCDAALYSADFRGPERMAQTITQVAGRAGREAQQGEVYVQSQMPEHPMLRSVTTLSYADFAQQMLEEREALNLPPFVKCAALLGEHRSLDELLAYMSKLWVPIESSLQGQNTLSRVGPVPAPMIRKANRFRAQLLLYSSSSNVLHQTLNQLRHAMDSSRAPNGLRLALDIDPIDTN